MLGISDVGIWSAYILCIISALICVAYGVINWNKGNDAELEEAEKALKWEESEREMKETL